MIQTLCTFIPQSNIPVKNVGSKEYPLMKLKRTAQVRTYMQTCNSCSHVSDIAHTHTPTGAIAGKYCEPAVITCNAHTVHTTCQYHR